MWWCRAFAPGIQKLRQKTVAQGLPELHSLAFSKILWDWEGREAGDTVISTYGWDFISHPEVEAGYVDLYCNIK